jgi:hypothetical protein
VRGGREVMAGRVLRIRGLAGGAVPGGRPCIDAMGIAGRGLAMAWLGGRYFKNERMCR